jgi:hypothetical protein
VIGSRYPIYRPHSASGIEVSETPLPWQTATPCSSAPWTTPTPLQLALARGQRWLAMPESGAVSSIKEIARREGVNDSYVSRMVNLTTLSPDIVGAIPDETSPKEVTLFELTPGTPLL